MALFTRSFLIRDEPAVYDRLIGIELRRVLIVFGWLGRRTAEVLHVNVLCYCFSVVAGHLCYGGYICYTLSVIEFPDVVDLIHCQHSPSSFSFIL